VSLPPRSHHSLSPIGAEGFRSTLPSLPCPYRPCSPLRITHQSSRSPSATTPSLPLLLPSVSRASSPNNSSPLLLLAVSPLPPPLHPRLSLHPSSVVLSPLSPSLPLQRVPPSSTRVLPSPHRYRLSRLGSCLALHPFPQSPPQVPPSSTSIPPAPLLPSNLLSLVPSVPSGFSPATPNW